MIAHRSSEPLEPVSGVGATPATGMRVWERREAPIAAEDRSPGLAPPRSPGVEATESPFADLRFPAPDAYLSFEKDEASGKTVLKIIDRESGEVLRQVPPEEMLRVAAIVRRYVGLLVDHRQ